MPRLDAEGDALLTIPGNPPNLLRLPKGCPFQPRCPHAMEICNSAPPLEEFAQAACAPAFNRWGICYERRNGTKKSPARNRRSESALFDIKDGKQWFWQPSKTLKAVDGVTLRLYEGETLGVVGESDAEIDLRARDHWSGQSHRR